MENNKNELKDRVNSTMFSTLHLQFSDHNYFENEMGATPPSCTKLYDNEIARIINTVGEQGLYLGWGTRGLFHETHLFYILENDKGATLMYREGIKEEHIDNREIYWSILLTSRSEEGLQQLTNRLGLPFDKKKIILSDYY